MAGILDAEPPRAVQAQHVREREERVRRAGVHADPVVAADRPARAREKRREPLAELERSERLAVREVGVGGAAHRRAACREPRSAREEREVGQIGAQVEARGGDVHVLLEVRRRLERQRRDDRRCAPARDEVALGCELRVRTDDDAARELEIGCERAGRGQRGTGREAARPDQAPHLGLDLAPEGLRRVEAHRQKWSC